MSLGQAVTSVLKNYAVFRGRAPRSEFWWYYLAYVVVAVIVFFIDNAIGANSILLSIFFLALLLPTLAVQIRRLHDTDRAGWWWFIGFVPFVGGIVLLVFFCLASTPGDNRYGPPAIVQI